MRAARRARGSQISSSASVTRSTTPYLQESQPPQVSVRSRPNHGLEDPIMVSPGRPPAWGYLKVSNFPPEEHGIEGLFSSCTLRWPSSATHTRPAPGGGSRPPGGRGPRPSPRSSRSWPPVGAGPPLFPVLALPGDPAPPGQRAGSARGCRVAGAESCGASPCWRGGGWRRGLGH